MPQLGVVQAGCSRRCQQLHGPIYIARRSHRSLYQDLLPPRMGIPKSAGECHGASVDIPDPGIVQSELRPPADGGAVQGEDDIPEPPVTPVSVAGNLWQLGSHRLICGDSTSADVVGRLLGDVKPLLMVTDPPYGVEYDPSWRN